MSAKNKIDWTPRNLTPLEEIDAIKFLKEEDEKAGTKGYLQFKQIASGIGTITEVRHSITEEANITDYDCW